MRANLCFARFPYHASEHPDATDWLIQTALKVKNDPRVDMVNQLRLDDTPITMTRNKAVKLAKQQKADYLVMIDADMCPDLPGQQPFWDTSWNWMWQRRNEVPAIIAAPYVGPPPHCNVYVFQWANLMNDNPHPHWKLDQYGREQASMMQGIQAAAALPTGLIIIDMRVFDYMKHPYFYYEWDDETQSNKASTEDVTFTRDASLLGMGIYCNWDSWAGHWKAFRGDKPRMTHTDQVGEHFAQAVRRNIPQRLKQVYIEPPAVAPHPAAGQFLEERAEAALKNGD